MKTEHLVIFLGALLLLTASLPLSKSFLSIEFIIALDLLLVIGFYLFLLRFGKKHFKKDFKKYALFFSLWLIIVQGAIFSILFLDPLKIGVELFLGVLMALLLVSIVFRFLLGKKEVIGTILLSDSESAAVKVDFDLFAGLNEGKYVVKANQKYKKGKRVRVALKRKRLKKTPHKIIGKAKE